MSDTAPDLVMYGSPVSPFVRKAAALCIEKDVPFEIEAVDVFNPPQWFRDISPLKRIPVLRDRSIAAEGVTGTIADSSAICGYIEKKYPAPALYPAEPFAYGRALFIEEYADTHLAATGGLGIFRPIFFNAMQGKEPDLDKAKATWSGEMPAILSFLNDALGESDFYAGDTLSIADISVTATLMQIALVANMPLDNYPALAAHYDRVSARPSIAGPFAKANGFIRKTLPDLFDLT
ncbi:glutathione S-transferase family protein [Erythrobacter crassostreae]|uniref:Glutathione S-transferase family protein n=1 Tax=Erythrobacter crassostreae TaxID=2828328 RepID=A0A9X1F4Y5_9SPHN|nr:glutathione S-transferase family protein [Erythrobacter crassostrea]MBV7258890.1 glutathione S-transferase family protein [Erythrobacter crassostrea]